MTSSPTKPILTCEDLISFWFQGGLLGVLEGDQTRSAMTLTILQQKDWHPVSRTTLEDRLMPLGRHPWDAVNRGEAIWLVWQANTDEPLEVVALPRRDFLDDPIEELSTSPTHPLRLDAAQAARVHLTAPPWNGLLPPEKTLFHPRFVGGGTSLVIANTADNQAMLFSFAPEHDRGSAPIAADADFDPSAFAIPNAFGPQAWYDRGSVAVAFRRFAKNVCPFWEDTIPASGDLFFAPGSRLPVNLSSDLGFGPILDFALVAGEQRGLVALKEQPIGSELLALAYDGGQWSLQARTTLDGDFRAIRCAVQGNQVQLVLAERNDPAEVAATSPGKNWTLHYLAWPPKKQARP